MASIISAGTSSGTALNFTGDTSGNLAFQTGAGANTITVPNETGTIITNKTAGTVLQVVNVTYSTQVSTASSTFSDTGLTLSITPKFSTSKILAIVSISNTYKTANDTSANYKLFRNSTEIALFGRYVGGNGVTAANLVPSTVVSYLDSPATTSSTTYKVQFNNDTPSSTVVMNFGSGVYPVSTITLMEIAA